MWIYLRLTFGLIGDVLRRQNDQAGAFATHGTRERFSISCFNTTRAIFFNCSHTTYGDTGQEAAFERHHAEATDLLAFFWQGIDAAPKRVYPALEIYEIRGKGKP